MILYFSGTGNSRFIAEKLADILNDEIIDTTKHIKENSHPEFSSDKPYVVIAPIYAWRMPRALYNWLLKCSFSGNKKIYFVFTCGDSIGAAERYMAKLAEKLNTEYMGTTALIMPENYIVMFKAPDNDEAKEIIEKAKARLSQISDIINRQTAFKKEKYGILGRLESGIINGCFYTFTVKDKKFTVNDSCTSCGKCEKLCMVNNIKLKNGKPVWQGNCIHCLACMGYCPTKAINYGKRTVNMKKYTFPEEKEK